MKLAARQNQFLCMARKNGSAGRPNIYGEPGATLQTQYIVQYTITGAYMHGHYNWSVPSMYTIIIVYITLFVRFLMIHLWYEVLECLRSVHARDT